MTSSLSFGDILILMGVAAVLLIVVVYITGRIMATISFTVNIVISAGASPLAAVADPLNLTGTVNQPFSASLASNVQGGTPPYTLTVNGALPSGLTADAAGNITGTPTTAGTTTLSVGVADSGA